MMEATRYERWYGRDEAPSERTKVSAGRLTAELEGPDLRYVRVEGVEVVRRLYAAVRDRNWGTVPPQLANTHLEQGDDTFRLRFEARHLDEALGIDFTWHGEIAGAADATLTCSLDGIANRGFAYNRIGWCILHPADNAGRRFRARSSDAQIDDRLPREIGPQLIVNGLPAPLFPGFHELEIEVADDVWARFELEGDQFEMEDQRNWTDASFKTYSTPLSLGFPHGAVLGQRIRQAVRLTVAGRPRAGATAAGSAVVVNLGPTAGHMPSIGLGTASHGKPLSQRESALLAELRPAHLRVDVDLANDDWRDALERGLADAHHLGAPVELAVCVGSDDDALDTLGEILGSQSPRVARVLAFRKGEPTSSARTVQLVRDRLQTAAGGAPVYGGSNILFTELNRFRPELAQLQGVAWPVNATVHASDDVSVLETAAMHGETVRSARQLCGSLPLAVTPVTFNQRFNPVATGPEPEPGPGELPSQVDRRQPSLLAAVWTLVSAKHLAQAGAASVTYFETTGWRGVIETDEGTGLPDRFCSRPATVFPVYHVLADLCELAGAQVLEAPSTEPLAVEALAVRQADRQVVLVANLSPDRRRCRITALRIPSVAIRRLDEESCSDTCGDPVSFRSRGREVASVVGGELELELAPFSVLRLEPAA
jgi:D-apionolactonase